MILTKPEKSLLRSMKDIQGVLNDYVLIYDNKLYHSKGYNPADEDRAYSENKSTISKLDPYLQNQVLKHLIEHGYIKKCGSSPTYRVTYEGWYCSYITGIELWHKMLNSVICPIIVSVLTTLLINLISNLL